MEPFSQLSASQARACLESARWPAGLPICPHCGWNGACYRLQPRDGSSTRDGVWRCGGCRKQFTVTVKTIFEGGKLPLPIWLHAIDLLCRRPEGWAVRELGRELGISYRGAWALCDRIRYATTQNPFPQARRAGQDVLRTPGPATLHPLSPALALACLLSIVPEHKHPLATERRNAFWEKRKAQ